MSVCIAFSAARYFGTVEMDFRIEADQSSQSSIGNRLCTIHKNSYIITFRDFCTAAGEREEKAQRLTCSS